KAATRTRLRAVRNASQGTPVPASMRDPFRDASRTEYVHRYILQAIRDGQFRQGDRVREEDLAMTLGVSRTPAREALRQLQSQGLIDITAGRGAGIVELSLPQILEIYAMREILEGAAARMAAEHATPAEISYLSHLLQEFGQSRDPIRLAAVNIAFHRSIGEAAHNRYLIQSLDKLRDVLALLQGTTFSVKGRPTTAAEEHRAIFQAIQARKPDAAEQAARAHIRSAR